MAVVHIRVNGQEYDIACDNGQEDHLRFLADEVDDRIRSLSFGRSKNPGESMSLLMAALMMADEILENRKEMREIAGETNRLAALAAENNRPAQANRMLEIESAMATTLEEIALKIEKIADRIETP
jgi:cell division protein ZapA